MNLRHFMQFRAYMQKELLHDLQQLPLLTFLFFSENMTVDPAYEWSAVEHLIENCHREVHTPGLDEGTEGLLFLKKDRRNEAHDRAHHRADTEGDRVGDEGWAIIWTHDLEGQHVGNVSNHEELEAEGNRNHDRNLVESSDEAHRGHAACV